MVLEAFAYVILNFIRGYNTICSFIHIVRGAVASCSPVIAPAYPSVSLYRYTIQAARAVHRGTLPSDTQVIHFVTISRLTTLKRCTLLYSCILYTLARLETTFYCTRLSL